VADPWSSSLVVGGSCRLGATVVDVVVVLVVVR